MLSTTRFFIVFILLLLSTAVASAVHAANAVIVEDANLRAKPDDTAKIITPLRKDTQVLTKDSQRDWVKVEVPALAKTGWVHKSLINENQVLQLAKTKEKKVIEPAPHKISKTTDLSKNKQPDRPLQIIGVIDIQQVINQSIRGKQARLRFEGMRLTGSADQVARIEQEMLSRVIAEIQSIVEKYAVEKGFTHVLNKNSGSIFYNEAGFDISSDIIREYDRQASPQQPEP